MHPAIVTTQPYSELLLTDEYLDSLSVDMLFDLMLHRTNLLLTGTKNHISDPSYLGSLEYDLKKIYATIRSRSDENS